MVLDRLVGAKDVVHAVRPEECAKKDLIREKFTLSNSHGNLEGEVFRAPGPPRPAVMVNCACYSSMVKVLEKDALFYATRGYVYILAFQPGAPTEVADKLFVRWHEDAAVLLDWLGKQEWCDGRVGVHGMSLLGNTAFAALQVSLAEDAPPSRPKVCAVFPAITFSRIHPTIFFSGKGLAAELIARFLWLAEVGTREGSLRGLAYVKAMLGFFAYTELPGLHLALNNDLSCADKALWKRTNFLWQEGIRTTEPTDPFWQSRDTQCDLQQLGAALPPIHIVSGWWDVFKDQSLQDYAAAVKARGSHGSVRLTIYAGGHFGVAGKSPEVTPMTLDWYDKHIRGMEVSLPEKPVRVEVIGAKEGGEFLELDSWPPPEQPSNVQELYLEAGANQSRIGVLVAKAPTAAGSMQYVYDPRDPTPYSGGGWLNMRKDGSKTQQVVEKRSDVLVFTSQPVDHTTMVAGNVSATLYAGSSAPECDFVMRLCVVRAPVPGRMRWFSCAGRLRSSRSSDLDSNHSWNICEGYARVRFDNNPKEGDGRFREISLDLGATCSVLHPGDQVRVQVCSAAHPKALRHPLSPNGDTFSHELGPAAVQEIFADPQRPSSIRLPCLGQRLQPRRPSETWQGA